MSDKSIFEYAEDLAGVFEEVVFDDDGGYQMLPHHTCFTMERNVSRIIQGLNLSEDAFYKQERIIPVLEAYELDKEKFWYAVVYVAYLTNSWSGAMTKRSPLPSNHDQLKRLRDEIVRCAPERCPKGKSNEEIKSCPESVDCIRFNSCHEFKVVFESATESHSFVMAGNGLMALLASAINDLIKKTDGDKTRLIPILRDKQTRKTEMTWYAAHLFKRLLGVLKLPVIRSRKKQEHFDVNTYDKNQLIAELIHFLNLTDNPDLDGFSIRGILNSNRQFTLDYH